MYKDGSLPKALRELMNFVYFIGLAMITLLTSIPWPLSVATSGTKKKNCAAGL